MNFENTEVWGFEHAIRGMRNSYNSWENSDSRKIDTYGYKHYIIGEDDLKLMSRLITSGSSHRKFLRQIIVSVDITAPLYWYKQFDTYKIGTTANSTSTMHTLLNKPININNFEMGDYDNDNDEFWDYLIKTIEKLRLKYIETKDYKVWKEIIRLLPEAWLQTRTITMSYENILCMYHQRKNHKLIEWNKYFTQWVKGLPYAKELIIGE